MSQTDKLSNRSLDLSVGQTNASGGVSLSSREKSSTNQSLISRSNNLTQSGTTAPGASVTVAKDELNREQRRRNLVKEGLTKSVLSSHGGSSASKDSNHKQRQRGASAVYSSQYRSLQVQRKNSAAFDSQSSGGERTGGAPRNQTNLGETGSLGRRQPSLGTPKSPQQAPLSGHRKMTFSSSQKRVANHQTHRSLILPNSQIASSSNAGGIQNGLLPPSNGTNLLQRSQVPLSNQGTMQQPVLNNIRPVLKKKKGVKKVVKKRIVAVASLLSQGTPNNRLNSSTMNQQALLRSPATHTRLPSNHTSTANQSNNATNSGNNLEALNSKRSAEIAKKRLALSNHHTTPDARKRPGATTLVSSSSMHNLSAASSTDPKSPQQYLKRNISANLQRYGARNRANLNSSTLSSSQTLEKERPMTFGNTGSGWRQEPFRLSKQLQKTQTPQIKKLNQSSGSILVKKRLATPLKIDREMLESEAANLDPILADLNREIQELRQKRLNHTMMRSSLLREDSDDLDEGDKEDNFEAVLLAETLISELDSPSAAAIPAESTTDIESKDRQKPKKIHDEMLTEQNQTEKERQEEVQNQEVSENDSNLADKNLETQDNKAISPQKETFVYDEENQSAGHSPIKDVHDSISSNMPTLADRLSQNTGQQVDEPVFQHEISNLLGNILVRASNIKESLQKQKTVIIQDDLNLGSASVFETPKTEGDQSISTSDIALQLDQQPSSPKQNQPLQSLAVNDQDIELNQSSLLDQSICSVVPAGDVSKQEDTDLNISLNQGIKSGLLDESVNLNQFIDSEPQSKSTCQKEEDKKEPTFTLSQVEIILSDLKTRHIAEKRLLSCDLMLCKKTIQVMSQKLKLQVRQNHKYEIKKLHIRKLQELNKTLKLDNERLVSKNSMLTEKFTNLHTLVMDYEKESTYRKAEEDWIFEELVKENDNLKRLLLINHDFTHDIESRMQAIEKEEQEKKLKMFKLQRLKEEAERRLNESLSPQKSPFKGLNSDSKSDDREEMEDDSNDDSDQNDLSNDKDRQNLKETKSGAFDDEDDNIDERDDFDQDLSDNQGEDEEGGQEEMPQEIKLLVQKRIDETNLKRKPAKIEQTRDSRNNKVKQRNDNVAFSSEFFDDLQNHFESRNSRANRNFSSTSSPHNPLTQTLMGKQMISQQRRTSNVKVQQLQDCLIEDNDDDIDNDDETVEQRDVEDLEPQEDEQEEQQTQEEAAEIGEEDRGGRDDPLNKSGRLSLKEELAGMKGELEAEDGEDLENFQKFAPPDHDSYSAAEEETKKNDDTDEQKDDLNNADDQSDQKGRCEDNEKQSCQKSTTSNDKSTSKNYEEIKSGEQTIQTDECEEEFDDDEESDSGSDDEFERNEMIDQEQEEAAGTSINEANGSSTAEESKSTNFQSSNSNNNANSNAEQSTQAAFEEITSAANESNAKTESRTTEDSPQKAKEDKQETVINGEDLQKAMGGKGSHNSSPDLCSEDSEEEEFARLVEDFEDDEDDLEADRDDPVDTGN